MKITFLAVPIAVITALLGTPVIADCTTPACLAATRWHVGFTAVVLEDNLQTARHFDALAAIKAVGGYAALETDHVVLGWLPRRTERKLVGQNGINSVHHGAASLRAAVARHPARTRQDDIYVDFFEEVVSGRLKKATAQGMNAPLGPPLVGDARPNPARARHMNENSSMTRLRASTQTHQVAPWTNALRGRIRVIAFQMESDGTADPNQYSWQISEYDTITNQILMGFAFWSNQAQQLGIDLSFIVGVWQPYALNTWTGYEAITHPWTDDYLWVNDIMRKQDTNPPYNVNPFDARPGGFGASPVTHDNVFLRPNT